MFYLLGQTHILPHNQSINQSHQNYSDSSDDDPMHTFIQNSSDESAPNYQSLIKNINSQYFSDVTGFENSNTVALGFFSIIYKVFNTMSRIQNKNQWLQNKNIQLVNQKNEVVNQNLSLVDKMKDLDNKNKDLVETNKDLVQRDKNLTNQLKDLLIRLQQRDKKIDYIVKKQSDLTYKIQRLEEKLVQFEIIIKNKVSNHELLSKEQKSELNLTPIQSAVSKQKEQIGNYFQSSFNKINEQLENALNYLHSSIPSQHPLQIQQVERRYKSQIIQNCQNNQIPSSMDTPSLRETLILTIQQHSNSNSLNNLLDQSSENSKSLSLQSNNKNDQLWQDSLELGPFQHNELYVQCSYNDGLLQFILPKLQLVISDNEGQQPQQSVMQL